MIIRRDSQSFLCIRQPDHAALAAHVMAAWNGLADHPRREAILFATREHDNGWVEEDADTHLDRAGEPLDFVAVPAAVKHRLWPRALARVERERPYEAALIAQHALTVHDQNRDDPAWRPFFESLERRRHELLERSGPGAFRTIDDDYAFVRQGDELSLIFCNGWSSPFPRPGGKTVLKGHTLFTTPDPFSGRSVPLCVAARRIPARRYASSADLRAALDAAPPIVVEGEAVGTLP